MTDFKYIKTLFNINEYYDVIYASSNREQFEKIDSIINSLGER